MSKQSAAQRAYETELNRLILAGYATGTLSADLLPLYETQAIRKGIESGIKKNGK